MREDRDGQPIVARALIKRLRCYYGWIVLGCVCCAAFGRAGPAVATLSVFVQPMVGEFGWSRAELSGAVSLGGIVAAGLAPMLGTLFDRRGSRPLLCAAVLTTGAALLALSQVESLIAFYLLFCTARMNFAGPFDLGIYGLVSNWFVRRRALAAAVANLAEKVGLVLLPLLAYAIIAHGDWRAAWAAVGAVVLVVGFLPSWLLVIHRPEDVGQHPRRFGRRPRLLRCRARRSSTARVGTGCRAAVYAHRGDAHARLLDALSVHADGLSGAGRQ